MVILDPKTCNLCGLCVKVCHEYCIRIENQQLEIDHTFCSTCTQCIAICPQQALSWDKIPPEAFNREKFPAPEQVEELFKERRTIRDYTPKKIERSLLEEIAGYIKYAPTHNFKLRVIILDDDRVIGLTDSIVYSFSLRLYRWFFKSSFMHGFVRTFTPSHLHEYLKAKPKLENMKRRARGYKTNPAAIIMVIGDKRVPLTLESAQYALYNMDLYAQSKGLACRNLVGNQGMLNRSRELRKTLGLKKFERIFAIMTLGYPAVRFRNKVAGKKADIQWNTEKGLKSP